MFDAIAPRYDRANRLISLGMDLRWRWKAVRRALAREPRVVLDVGAGTGDLTRMVAAAGGPHLRAIGVDFSLPMLRVAATRPGDDPQRVRYVQGDALTLPVGPESVDAIITAFTIRNIRDLPAVMKSFARVLKPGGTVTILEITPMGNGPVGWLFRLYFGRVVPLLGRLVTGHPFAYRYLPESVQRFRDAEGLARLLCENGFDDVSFTRLGMGSVALHHGVRSP